MEKFAGKYRIESNRLQGWNYASNGAYFITLVTKDRECNLGHIENDKIILSDFGKIIETEWLKSFEIRTELFLDEYIIMPNHLHAIVILGNMKINTGGDYIGAGGDDVGARGDDIGERGNDNDTRGDDIGERGNDNDTRGDAVETHGRASLQQQQQQQPESSPTPSIDPPTTPSPALFPNQPYLQRKPESISSFIGGFKSSINTKIDDFIDDNHLNIPKYNRTNHFFQPNYHDRVIRNRDEYLRIKNYIINNLKNWDKDNFNKTT